MLWLTLRKMNSDDWRKRLAAVNELANSTEPRAVEALVKALNDRSREVRWSSALALGARGDPRSVPSLIECYESAPDTDIAQHVLNLLAQFAKCRNDEASNKLMDLTARERYAQVKKEIAHGTRTAGLGCSKGVMLLGLKELTNLALATERRHDAVDEMRKAIQYEEDPEIRHLAAICLGTLLSDGGKNPVGALCYQLDHENWQLIKSEHVLAALGALRDPSAVDTLTRRGKYASGQEQRYALYQALSEIPDTRCVSLLMSYLRKGDCYNQHCYAALKAAVRTYPDKLDEELLEALASLDSVIWADVYEDSTAHRPIDCGEVRETARKELDRRHGREHASM